MRNLIFCTLSLLLGFNAAAYKLDVRFDELKNCEGKFQYQQVFLLEGRGPSDLLAKDPSATRLINGLNFGGRILRPVSAAYSIELFKNYIHYDSFKGHVEKLAVALVEKDNHIGTAFDYDLVLVATAGELKGIVLAQREANFNSVDEKLESDFFSCWK